MRAETRDQIGVAESARISRHALALCRYVCNDKFRFIILTQSAYGDNIGGDVEKCEKREQGGTHEPGNARVGKPSRWESIAASAEQVLSEGSCRGQRRMHRIIVADPHPVSRRGIVNLLREYQHDVILPTDSAGQAGDAIETLRPDLLIMDVALPGYSALELVRALRVRDDPTRIILLSCDMTDEQIIGAQQLMVEGLLLKSCPEEIILRCIDEVMRGRPWVDRALVSRIMAVYQKRGNNSGSSFGLSEKEQAIASMAARGKRNREIAESLGIAEGTVKVHLYNIFRKVGVRTRIELALLYEKNDLGTAA